VKNRRLAMLRIKLKSKQQFFKLWGLNNMRRILPLIVFILCFSKLTSAQSKWSVSISPAAVAAPNLKNGIQPGFEYRFDPKWTLSTEFTFITNSRKNDPSFSHPSYLRIKPEIKYIYIQPRRGFEKYFAFQFAYVHRKWTDASSGSYTDEGRTDSSIRYSSAKISSPVFTAALKWGDVLPFGKHIRADLSFGLGVRVINTNYSEVTDPAKYMYQQRRTCMPVPDAAYAVQGLVCRPHFTTALKLLYQF
jgi:hypothetical protein